MQTTASSRRGVILLIVLGVLALMSVMTIAFVQMSSLERAISQNYLAKTRALMAAESGLEYAAVRLKEISGVLTADQVEAMRYQPNGSPGLAGLLYAVKPSFNLPAPHGDVSGIVGETIAGGSDVYKLRVSEDSGKLNLNDSNGLWNIDTDPWPDSDFYGEGDDADIDASLPRLSRLIEELCTVLFPGEPGLAGLVATELIFARDELPGKRFSSTDQLREILLDSGILDSTQYSDFIANVTLWTWQDETTIRPTFKFAPKDVMLGRPQNEFNVYLYSDFQTQYFELEPRCPINVNSASVEMLQALIAPVQGWYLYEGTPCSLADGGQGPWFKALRYTGYSFRDRGIHNGYPGNFIIPFEMTYNGNPAKQSASGNWNFGHSTRYGQARLTDSLEPVAAEIARILWQRIHEDDPGTSEPNDARPFSTWDEFTRFLYSLVDTNKQITFDQASPDTPMDYDMGGYDEGQRFPYRLEAGSAFVPPSITVSDFDRYMADALLANFNPNSQLNDFNPDFHIFRHVDKAQLTHYTTELCFMPTGVFTIESLGAVRDENNANVSSVHVQTTLKLFYVLRHTTQQQFMRGYDVDNPDSQYDLFQESFGIVPTAGADLVHGDGSLGGNRRWGASVTSYPEPIRMPGSESLTGQPSNKIEPPKEFDWFSKYDGSLMLSTYQRDLASWTDTSAAYDPESLAPGSKALPVLHSDPPQFMAPMGYRWLDMAPGGWADYWNRTALAAGGLLPVRFGKNPNTATDDLDTMNVAGGRGVILAWDRDYTVPEIPQIYLDIFPPDEPLPQFLGMIAAPRMTEGIPNPEFRLDQPWVDYSNWAQNVPVHNGDHFWHNNLGCFVTVIEGGSFIYGGLLDRIGWNTPSDFTLTPDLQDQQSPPRPVRLVPGTLYPDGVFSEAGRSLSYKSTNMGSRMGTRGSVGFWVKPHFDAGYSNRMREFFTVGHIGMSYLHGLDLLYMPLSRRPLGAGSDVASAPSEGPVEADPGPLHEIYVGASPGMDPWPFPTHSFFFGWMNQNWCPNLFGGPFIQETAALSTSTATDYFPFRVGDASRGNDYHFFYGHQWNYVGMSYNAQSVMASDGAAENHLTLSINGVPTESKVRQGNFGHDRGYIPPDIDWWWEEWESWHLAWKPNPEPHNIHMGEDYMRFGWCEEAGGPVADSTYDEICAWGGYINSASFTNMYLTGRYCGELLADPPGAANANTSAVGLFTSAPLDLFSELNEGPMLRGSTLTLNAVCWTGWWPRYNLRGGAPMIDLEGIDVNNAAKKYNDPVTGAWDPFSVDIYTSDQQWCFSNDTDTDSNHSRLFSNMNAMPASGAGVNLRDKQVRLSAGDKFRYRVYFQLPGYAPLLESPVLDDITFIFTSSKPVILEYRYLNS